MNRIEVLRDAKVTGLEAARAVFRTGSISAHHCAHGTTRSIYARNCARRFAFACFSNPVAASVNFFIRHTLRNSLTSL
jgi:hypothetical protein